MSMRKLLVEVHQTVDYSDPELVRQAEAVNVVDLESRIERLVTRAAVIAHAFDVMKDGTYKHPIAAFMHATECPLALPAGPLSDNEFYHLLQAWAKLVNITPPVIVSPASSW